MGTDRDVVVVGARCAGAATAMLLAQRGHRVLMVDKARFPSEVPQGHFIHRHGPGRLERWGLLDPIVASGCPPITTLTTDFGDFPLVARDLAVDGLPWGCGPRRRVLDELLVNAAVRAGAELCEGFAVDDVLRDGDTVAGVRGRIGRAASAVDVRARLTIGADGRRSRVARAVGATSRAELAPLTCCYFSYWSGLTEPGLEYHIMKERRAVFAFPTNERLYAVFIFFPIEEFAQVRADIEGSFRATFRGMGRIGQLLLEARREERYYGTADLPNFMRRPFGPGWALVGDAGCHKDPYQALGICDALRDAELLADAAHAALSGGFPPLDALAGYEERRDRATLPDYEENIQLARLLPLPPDVLQLRAALRDRPADTTHFFKAWARMIPHEEFFNPGNLERLLGQPRGAAGRPCPTSPRSSAAPRA
jgi:flavin-dependent dehydrogenase